MKTLGQVLRDLKGYPDTDPIVFETDDGQVYEIGKVGLGKFEGQTHVIIKQGG